VLPVLEIEVLLLLPAVLPETWALLLLPAVLPETWALLLPVVRLILLLLRPRPRLQQALQQGGFPADFQAFPEDSRVLSETRLP